MRRQVLEGGWDPDKKATLKTFFVTASLYGFAKEYRVYYREEMGGHRLECCVDDVSLLVDHDQQYGPGPPEDPSRSRLIEILSGAYYPRIPIPPS